MLYWKISLLTVIGNLREVFFTVNWFILLLLFLFIIFFFSSSHLLKKLKDQGFNVNITNFNYKNVIGDIEIYINSANLSSSVFIYNLSYDNQRRGSIIVLSGSFNSVIISSSFFLFFFFIFFLFFILFFFLLFSRSETS
jgi:hypothetical protein